ncbi:MAG: ADP-ribosylglycohydrolase family protein [Lentisphaeraceae bacterium]|nr:ADP-ribosylglycohydrolase family protein [Lentisphaeraceae bacterium]
MNHLYRLNLAWESLQGLSIGDSFGECFFTDIELVRGRLAGKHEPPSPWLITDDSVMAIGIYNCLKKSEKIIQNDLAQEFSKNFMRCPDMGYGASAAQLLRSISHGQSWKELSKSAFDGTGSMGNGGAMRIPPIGAYYYDDYNKVIENASRCTEITHFNNEAIAGSIAVAIATALVCRLRAESKLIEPKEFIEEVCKFTPPSRTLDKMKRSLNLTDKNNPKLAALKLGNGDTILTQDTVPFVIWAAAQYLDNFENALWQTVSVLGDRDTTCAMVGGIISAYKGENCIPNEWLDYRTDFEKFLL